MNVLAIDGDSGSGVGQGVATTKAASGARWRWRRWCSLYHDSAIPHEIVPFALRFAPSAAAHVAAPNPVLHFFDDMKAICVRSIFMPALLGAFVFSCSSSPKKVGKNPSWRARDGGDASGQKSSGKAPESSPRISAQRPIVFAPSGQAASFYNDPPVASPPSDPLGDRVVAAIDSFHSNNGGTPPVPDGRLYRAASELAEVVREDAPLAYPMVEFALQRHGIIEPSPHILVVWGPLHRPEAIVEKLAERLPEILANNDYARVGVGSAVRKESGEGAAILALQSSYVTTKPIPRELPGGGLINLEGAIDKQYRNPQVFVTREDGSVATPKLSTRRSGAFKARVSCKGRRGRQQIEITAVDASGSSVLANFPVWCNERAPDSVTIEPTIDEKLEIATEAQAEALMLKLVNRDRKKHGLPPLERSAEVTAVSRAHSVEMKETGVVAHISPTTGSAADRVRAAKIRTSVVLENVARAYGVAEAQDGLMNSPGHRANLLSDLVTHVGIGIVFGEETDNRREMFVTQVFTRVPPVTTPKQAKKRLHAMLRATRDVAWDKALATLAQEYADNLASGMSANTAARNTSKKLDDLANRYRRVTSGVTTVVDVESFDSEAVLSDQRITHYGLGVAKGTHKELGDNALFIVVLLGQAR